jgi:hypothetical protein
LKRSAISAGLFVAAVAVWALLHYETDALLFHESPLRWIDPSIGPDDPALVAQIEDALAAQSPVQRVPYLDAVEVGALSDAELRRRVSAVPGWDELVFVGSYDRGAERPRDPEIESWWLSWQLSHTDGPPQDGFDRVIVIRDQQAVGTIYIHGDVKSRGVVSRTH